MTVMRREGADPYPFASAERPRRTSGARSPRRVRSSDCGIASLNLNTRQLDFTPIGPAVGMTGLQLTPDRKTGYTVAFTGTGAGGVSQRTEFWVFDIPSRKLLRKQEFDAR